MSDEHFGNNTSIIKWKKNNRSDENLIVPESKIRLPKLCGKNDVYKVKIKT
jgi:hypothetical protein